MKKFNLYQAFAILTSLNSILLLISYLVCINISVQLKTLVSICSIFLFGIIFCYTCFHFSYQKYIHNIKLNKHKFYIVILKNEKSA